MSFLDWLELVSGEGSNINWLDIRDREGLPGIERELRNIIAEGGSMHLDKIYDVFFGNADPWTLSKL